MLFTLKQEIETMAGNNKASLNARLPRDFLNSYVIWIH